MAIKFLFLVLLVAFAAAKKDKKHDRHLDIDSDLVLPKPHKHIKSRAGRVLVWPENLRAFQEIRARGMIIELESNGMVLPMYVDADSLCYVSQGRASAGIVRPLGEATNTRYVRTGDVVALPAGWTVWLWNTGRSSMKMFCVNKPSFQEDCASCNAFFLAGGNQSEAGSVLHGFSDQVLSRTFDLDMKEARSLVDSQEDAVMVDTSEEFNVVSEESLMTGDLAFNMEFARPEMIESGGRMTLLDDSKMRILRDLSFGAVFVRLNPFSMFAPQWLHGFGQIVYITKGSARVEVSDQHGQPALNETLESGQVFVVPPFYPHVVVNNESTPAEWICIHFTSEFQVSFMSGEKSVYRSIPVEYLAAAFNTSPETAEKLHRSHENEKMFFKLDRVEIL